VKPLQAARPTLRIAALDHRDSDVAHRIMAVWRPAYTQEALLLNAKHFPPLGRDTVDIQTSSDHHIGTWRGDELIGVITVAPDGDNLADVCITGLVVHPDHQRLGAASALINAVLHQQPHAAFVVATGGGNLPALALYARFGFEVIRRGQIGPEALPLLKLRRAVPLKAELA
jgi:GNAT superfamily N-acetyltransferase